MPASILVSTAYLPPIEYFALLASAENVIIEQQENYLKQTYRNRCCILTSYGTQNLSVPILLGSLHKVKVSDIRIDYSKRWQQVHLGAIIVSYGASPYFEFYYESFKKIILKHNEFLLDLNIRLTEAILEILKVKCDYSLSVDFEPVINNDNDFRYRISPKIKSDFKTREYMHVFNCESYVQGLSIIDLIFNMGPEAKEYLRP